MKWVSVNRLRWLAILLLGALVFSPRGYAQSSLPVVPGAAGYGMNTRAAYACGSSPTIYRVTNLNDSGAGSLREALTASGPRVVIFETSGYINIGSYIVITSPCLTVAGQTAPSPGITVRMVHSGAAEALIWVNTHDVLFQHLRIRPGWYNDTSDSICNSGIIVYGGNHYNVVFDHMSFSWAQDENLFLGYGTTQNGGTDNVTVWRSIVAEGLVNAPGSGGCAGGGMGGGHGVLTGPTKRMAIIQTLFAGNRERNPWVQGAGWALLANNVVYNWSGEYGFVFSNYSPSSGSDPWKASVVGNRFIVGPYGNDSFNYVFYYTNTGTGDFAEGAGNQIYLSDNSVDASSFPNARVTFTENRLSYNPSVSAPPANAPLPSNLSVLPSSAVEQFVLSNAGARPMDRDAVDQRILRNVQNRTGGTLQSQNDVGGYPALAVNRRALTVPSNPHAVAGSGYTNLEVWLHGHAAAVETGADAGAAPQGPPPPTGLRIVS